MKILSQCAGCSKFLWFAIESYVPSTNPAKGPRKDIFCEKCYRYYWEQPKKPVQHGSQK